jgi:hypothetical protein
LARVKKMVELAVPSKEEGKDKRNGKVAGGPEVNLKASCPPS